VQFFLSFSLFFHKKTQEGKRLVVVANTTTNTTNTNQQQQFNNNNNNNEFPNVHAEKVVDVYICERVSRAETRAEEKSVGRVVVVIIILKEERIRC
jgi:hypothetical protein